MMYSTQNPSELYPGTTWELLATDKYLKTTIGTPLSTGGNNSVAIAKANLPNTKIQVESFNMTRGTMDITGSFEPGMHEPKATGAFTSTQVYGYEQAGRNSGHRIDFKASRTWTGATSNASPYTQALGSGTPLAINPTYITIRAWKRLS